MCEIDSVVGRRIKARRQALRMTQTQLADQIGVTFQQVQKYENGTNRVSAARLWQVSDVFQVPITYFFEGITSEGEMDKRTDILSDRGAMELIQLYTNLTQEQRKAVLSFLRSVADKPETAV